MPGFIAPAVPNRRMVWTPASASSWNSRIAPGPPTPCEATTTGRPFQLPLNTRYSRWYETSSAPSSSSATAAARAGSPTTTACAGRPVRGMRVMGSRSCVMRRLRWTDGYGDGAPW